MVSARTLSGTARRMTAASVKVAAAVVDAIAHPTDGVTVLIYHRVGGGSGSAVDLPVALFRAQMEVLAASGRVVTLGDAVVQLGQPIAKPSVVVTFDDGTTDWVEYALPVLAEFGVPATFYVATEFVETGRAWPTGAPSVSWAGLADMASTGLVTIGSHTHSHALLDRADGPTAKEEVNRSAGLIEERLGSPCAHFAYPKALLGSTEAEAEVKARFRSATLAGGGPNRGGVEDIHRLRRTPIQVNDGMRWFHRKANGGLRLEGVLRERISARRYAGSTW